jgi:glycosyltransferase involved in cell wall biosynthesis
MRGIAIVSVNRDPLGAIGSPRSGGQANYVRQLAARLAERAWRVRVYTSQFANPVEDENLTDLVSIHRVDAANVPTSVDNMSPDEAVALAPYYEERSKHFWAPSVVFACYWQSIPASRSIGRHFQRPCVLTYCSPEVLKVEVASLELNRARFELERAAANDFDAIVAKSRSERNLIISAYGAPGDKVHVIPNGVDFERFYERISPIAVHSEM